MKRIITLVVLLVTFAVLSLQTFAYGSYVRGYYRSNGTYVKPYYRSYSDGYKWNNWSSYGNYNPYTGAKGYRYWWSY